MRGDLRVRRYMSPGVLSVAPTASLPHVHEQLSRARVSSAPVVDAHGGALGMISLTDMLRVGETESVDGFGERIVQLPDVPVHEVMTRGLITLEATATVRRAARMMLKHRVQRLVVVDDEQLRGVIAARDVVRAVADSGNEVAVSEYMSEPVESVDVRRTLREAVDQLDGRRHSLVVLRDGRPVGAFTQADALAARQVLDDLRVEERMSSNVVVVGDRVPVDRVARRFIAASAPLAVVMWEGLGPAGVLSATDFLYAAL